MSLAFRPGGSPARDGEAFAREYVRYLKGEIVHHQRRRELLGHTLKRAYKSTFHRLSIKHVQRDIDEFAARHNVRELDALNQVAHVAAGMVGRRLMYRDLVADTGLSARAG